MTSPASANFLTMLPNLLMASFVLPEALLASGSIASLYMMNAPAIFSYDSLIGLEP